MAQDHVAAAHIGQHRRAGVAGVAARGVFMAVLAAQRDLAAGQGAADRNQQGRRRAHQKLALKGIGGAGPRRQVLGQGHGRGGGPVHLPVARDQLARHDLSSTGDPAPCYHGCRRFASRRPAQ
jgi:hypothetical protein